MTSLRTLAINTGILACIIVLMDVGARLYDFSRRCYYSSCDWHILSFSNFLSRDYIGISRYHPVLGYEPNPGTYRVSTLGWDDITVTITTDGLRSNGAGAKSVGEKPILTVGDSFTFGDQVNDDQTWPAFLQSLTNRPVDNGGVFGYSLGQAILRAEILSKKKQYGALVLSVFVPDDIYRDTLLMRSGFEKPAFSLRQDELDVSLPDQHRAEVRELIGRRQWLQHLDWAGYLWLVSRNLGQTSVGDDIRGTFTVEPRVPSDPIRTACKLLDRFRQIPVGPKVLVLQYQYDDVARAERPRESEDIKRCAEGAAVVDTWQIMRGRLASSLYVEGGHLNAAGNALVAGAIHEYLLALDRGRELSVSERSEAGRAPVR